MDAGTLKNALLSVMSVDADVSRAVKAVGYPAPRRSPPGFTSLARILVGQQLSIKAAATIYGRFEAVLSNNVAPDAVLAASFEDLRAAGLSNAKTRYLRALAEAIISSELNLDALADLKDKDAAMQLTQVKGIGPWTAQIYLLFCEGRADVWPAGDLAIQEAVRRLKGLKDRPSAAQTATLAKPWQPHRGAMAIFLWHYYAASDAPI